LLPEFSNLPKYVRVRAIQGPPPPREVGKPLREKIRAAEFEGKIPKLFITKQQQLLCIPKEHPGYSPEENRLNFWAVRLGNVSSVVVEVVDISLTEDDANYTTYAKSVEEHRRTRRTTYLDDNQLERAEARERAGEAPPPEDEEVHEEEEEEFFDDIVEDEEDQP